MREEFLGYERLNKKVGIRNKIAVLSSVLCVNHIVQQIAYKFDNVVGITHPLGCLQLGADYNYTIRTLTGLGSNPNIYGVLVIGLGCEGLRSTLLSRKIRRSKKPVEFFDLQDVRGGSIIAIEKGIKICEKLVNDAKELKREPFGFSNLILGLECGSSDAISGISANPAVGIVSDKIIELGGTCILPEFTEWIGTEHLLMKRAVNDKVAKNIQNLINKFLNKSIEKGIDFRGIQPTPGNIEGGLTTIEEKSLGTITKAGTAPIQGLLDYSETPKGKGLWLMAEPGIDVESMTGLAAAGSQLILMTTGRGTPCGNPVTPVIKISGNPKTCDWMMSNIDINASEIISGKKKIKDVAEVLWQKIEKVCNGEKTYAEQLGFNDLAIWRVHGPLPFIL